MELGAFNLEVVDVCMQSFYEWTHSKTIWLSQTIL